jgi:hypothetical protein
MKENNPKLYYTIWFATMLPLLTLYVYSLFQNNILTLVLTVLVAAGIWILHRKWPFTQHNKVTRFKWLAKILNDICNFYDDPIDMVKEWAHCHPLLFGYQLNISFMMRHRETTWNIIRRADGGWTNCDPEDYDAPPKGDEVNEAVNL